MANDLTKRLDEETQKANAARASSPETGAQLAAGGLTFRPGATSTPSATQAGYAGNSSGGSNDLTGRLDAATKQAESFRTVKVATPSHSIEATQPSSGLPSLNDLSKTFAPVGTQTNPVSAGITVDHPDNAPGDQVDSGTNLAARGLSVDPAGLNSDQRSAAAFAFSQGIDRATGTGPGATLDASLKSDASQRVDFSTMGKRLDAYQKDPNALAMANAREEMLGSGINLTHGPAGGLTITSHGIGQGALPSAGGSSINMSEANAVMARANETRQSMIDTPELKAKQQAEAERNRLYDARYQGQDPRRAEGDATFAKWDAEREQGSGRRGKQQQGQGPASARYMAMQQGIDQRVAGAVAQNTAYRKQDMDQQSLAAEQANQATRLGIDMERFDLDKQRFFSEQSAHQQLAKAMQSGDQRQIGQARFMAAAAGVKLPDQEKLQHVQTDNGHMAFNPTTGEMRPVTGPDGKPVGSSKALNETQAKATAYGMRAAEASRIIEEVGKNGEIQPSRIKQFAESVPLVGEALGMAANGLFSSPEQQQIEQGQRDFVNAVLRQESGAAIAESEFANAQKQYFPQPGDSKAVIEQKARNRQTAINGFSVAAGPGAKHIGSAPAPADQAAQGTQGEGAATPAPQKPWEKTWGSESAEAQQAREAAPGASGQPKREGNGSALAGRAVSALQGPAMGWYDEAVGATGALVEGIGNLTPWGTGRSMSEAYQKHRDDTRNIVAGHEKANPVMAQVDRATAAAPLALLNPFAAASRAVAGSGGLVSQAARTGAAAGTVAGAGDSMATDTGGVVKDMAAGAAGGAVMGPVAAGGISAASAAAKGLTRAAAKAVEGMGFAGVASRLGITQAAGQGALNQAAPKILQVIERDAGGRGALTNPLDVIAARQAKLGPEATIADAGGQNTRQLLDTLSTLPGKTKDMTERLIHDRQAGRAGRLIDAAAGGLSPDGKRLPDTLQALDAVRRQSSAPLYDRVRRTNITMDSDLTAILGRAQSAFGEARKLAELTGERFDLGDVQAKGLNDLLTGPKGKVPLQQLDTLKRTLYDLEQAHISPETGRLNEMGRAYQTLRRDLVGALDKATTDPATGKSFYRMARNAYAGPTELRQAANMGYQAMSKDGWKIRELIQDLSGGELQAFKIGAFESLRKKLGTEGGQTQILKMWKEPATAEKLKELFKDQKAFRQFAANVAKESRLKGLESVGRGSQTASRAAGMGDLDMTGITEAGHAARNAASGNLTGLLNTAANAWNRVSTPEPVRNEMGRLLTGKGQQGAANINEIRSIVEQILEDRAKRATQAGVIAGSQQ